jgi:hypothetical protein
LTNKKERTQKKKPKEGKKVTEKEEAPQEPLKEVQPQEAPVAVEPQAPKAPFESLTYPFKVIVSPMKAFQRISAYPDIKGFIIIIALLMLASAAVQFSVATKIILNINLQPTSLVATDFFQNFFIQGIIESIFIFSLNWLLFGGALLLIATIMGAKGGSWRQFFIIVGYALTVFILRTVVSAVLVSTLPQINFSLSAWPPGTEEERTNANNLINANWGPLLAFQAGSYVNLVFDAWLVILGATALRAYRAIPWSRAAIISVTAYLIYFTLRLFIGF